MERPGAALLPVRPLLAFLHKSEADSLRVEQTGDIISVRAGSATCRLQSGDVSRFPSPGPLPSRAHALLAASAFHQAIRRTLFAAARGPGHCRDYLLEAVLLEVSSAGLRLVASDNRRLAVAEVPFLARRAGGLAGRLLLSVAALALLGRLTRDEPEPVRAFFGATQAFFRVGRATVAARTLRGRFPDWRAALPGRTRVVAGLPVGALLSGVRQAAVLRERVHARVELRLERGRLTVESRQEGAGSVSVECPLAYKGVPVAVAFNPVYLLELLRSLEGEASVRLEVSAADSAVLFAGPEGYRHLLMPLRSAVPAGTPTPDSVFNSAVPLPH